MTEEFRYDRFFIENIRDKLDSNGFLTLSAKVTRTGVFNYRLDGKIVRELRHPDDVFDPESMRSLAMKPFTMLHSGKILDSETFKKHTHGTTGENITRTDDNYLKCNISVQDKKAIDTITGQNRTKLSAGYKCKIEKGGGEFEGVRFDQRQRNIKYNHVTGGLAAGEANGGDGCEFRFDQAFELIDKIEKEDSIMIKKEIPALEIGKGENVFRLDSLVIEETPEVVKLLAHREKLASALEQTQTRLDTIEGERDQIKTDNTKLEEELAKAIPAERFDSEVKERSELEKMAEEIRIKDFQKMSNTNIKKAICMSDNPEQDKIRLDSAGYLEGQFDQIKSKWPQIASRHKTLLGLKLKSDNNFSNLPDQTGLIDYSK